MSDDGVRRSPLFSPRAAAHHPSGQNVMSSPRTCLWIAAPLTAVSLLCSAPDPWRAVTVPTTNGPQSGSHQVTDRSAWSFAGGAELLAADPVPFVDTDGDLLPDRVERALLLDPLSADTDGDGVDDFLHAVQARMGLNDPRTVFGYDHEARVVVTTEPASGGGESAWVNLLFRFAGSSVLDLQALEPFIDINGQRHSLSRLLQTSLSRLQLLPHPTEGLYVHCAFRLGTASSLQRLLPCTIGAQAVLGGRTISSGSFLTDADGTTASLVPVAPDSGVIQSLSPSGDEDPFWTSSRVCLLRLSVVTSMPNGMLCEVSNADCIPSGELACPPSCNASRGQVLFVPDGLSTITGGGR
jgi:hypothetical protein